MPRLLLRYTGILVLVALFLFVYAAPATELAEEVDTPADVQEAFAAVMSVITHPRCMNCHPSDDYPRQGKGDRLHRFNVQRGADGHGVPGLTCQSCHQQENNSFSGVPGAPHWHLAPKSMGWMGLSQVEIARAMLNPEKNRGRTLEETVAHLTEDELVLWAWSPGVDQAGNPRERPPLSKEEWIKAVKTWAAAGAPIPEKK